MQFELKTGRGPYYLSLAKPPEVLSEATLLTVRLERLDGIETIALQCRIDTSLAGSLNETELLAKLAHWVERDFEMTRENALKSIRTERKLMELVFDETSRGPF